jgi:hypothetical protein
VDSIWEMNRFEPHQSLRSSVTCCWCSNWPLLLNVTQGLRWTGPCPRRRYSPPSERRHHRSYHRCPRTPARCCTDHVGSASSCTEAMGTTMGTTSECVFRLIKSELRLVVCSTGLDTHSVVLFPQPAPGHNYNHSRGVETSMYPAHSRYRLMPSRRRCMRT